MGQTKQKERKSHSNYHGNARRSGGGMERKSHSQTMSKKPGSSKLQAPQIAAKAMARPRVPFVKSDRVLCVGEGDFSFALSLAAHHNVKHVIATCYDDEKTLYRKYPQAQRIIHQLLSTDATDAECPLDEAGESEWHGLSPSPAVMDGKLNPTSSLPSSSKLPQTRSGISTHTYTSVHYSINATRLTSTHSKLLRPRSPFTKIVFNFPHVGGLSTDVNRQVRANQELVVGFLKSAIPLLASSERQLQTDKSHDVDGHPDDTDMDDGHLSEDGCENKGNKIATKGQILVTLFEGEPYTLWNIRDLARHCGLKVVESFRFPWEAYPGYAHARTVGDITRGKDRTAEGKRKGAWRGEERDARCYVLEVKEEDGIFSEKGVGTEASRVELGVRKRKRKAESYGSGSGSESD